MKLLCSLVGVAFLSACSSNPSGVDRSVAPTPPERVVASAVAPTPAPKGKLVIVGGGGTTDEIIQRALALAGGKDARMLVVGQASSDPKAGEESRVFWMEKGATNVGVLDLSDPKAALEEVNKAAFVWMPGGDQVRLMAAFDGMSPILDAIRKRYVEGAVVGGTSAGAAVISSVMLIGGDKADLKSVRAGGSQTSPGFGLWSEAIVDQHFVQRQRFTRLLACVLDHPELLGVGIDEKTAVVVANGRAEVIGESTVLVIDARASTRRETKAGELLSADDLKLLVLRRGDTFEYLPRAK